MYDRVRRLPFEVPAKTALGDAASADPVLTFRNVHNWAADGEPMTKAVFQSMYKALKPGGVLGVVDHRLPADRAADPKFESGYVHVAYVQRMAQSVGFRLAGASEINANPKDTADHPGGVWTLPPTYANKDQNRTILEAIGESDRMTLKFVKP